MTTDTSEKGLERLSCTALAGHPCDPPPAGALMEPRAGYGGVGWSPGSHHDYDREYCVDLAQLAAFLRDTQPEAAEAFALDEDVPTRRKFLARLQGEISKRARSRCCAMASGTKRMTSTCSTARRLSATSRPRHASSRTASL